MFCPNCGSKKKWLIPLTAAAAVLLIVIGIIVHRTSAYNPQKVKESGQITIQLGDSVYLESIKTTVYFAEALITETDGDPLTIDLQWMLALYPEKELSASSLRESENYEQWIRSAYFNDHRPVKSAGWHRMSYGDNSIWYSIRAVVDCTDSVSSLTCVINEDLSIVLPYEFPISSESILTEAAEQAMATGDYESAKQYYGMLGTSEAQRMIQSINCIDWANSVTDTLSYNQESILMALVGFNYSYGYDPMTYTYYHYIECPWYFDSTADLYDFEYGSEVLNEEGLYQRAEDLYFDYFYSAGYPDVTCTVSVSTSEGVHLGTYTYSPNLSDSADTSVAGESVFDEYLGAYTGLSNRELKLYDAPDGYTLQFDCLDPIVATEIDYENGICYFERGGSTLTITLYEVGVIELSCNADSFEGIWKHNINSLFYMDEAYSLDFVPEYEVSRDPDSDPNTGLPYDDISKMADFLAETFMTAYNLTGSYYYDTPFVQFSPGDGTYLFTLSMYHGTQNTPYTLYAVWEAAPNDVGGTTYTLTSWELRS